MSVPKMLFFNFCLFCSLHLSFSVDESYLEVYPDPKDPSVTKGRTPLFFALSQSLGGPLSLFDGSGSVAGVNVALDRINNDPSLLPGYTLHYTFTDSRCNETEGLNAFFAQVLRDPPKLAIVGSGCSPATEATAVISHFYNITQISCLSSSPNLRNRVRFPYYFQMLNSDDTLASVFYALFLRYNWKRVAVILQDENLFTVTIRKFRSLVESNIEGFSYSETIIPRNGGVSSLGANLFNLSARIFIIGAFPSEARKIACEAHKLNIMQPEYLLLTGWYRSDWWKVHEDDLSCSVPDRERVLQDTLAFLNYHSLTDSDDIDTSSDTGISGKEYLELEKPFLEEPPLFPTQLEISHYCYDGVYTLAYALNNAITAINQDESLKKSWTDFYNTTELKLEDFTYENDILLKAMFNSLSKTSFNGVSGSVMFDDTGIRIFNGFTILQYQRGSSSDLGVVTVGFIIQNSTNNDFQYVSHPNSPATWKEGIPYDGTPRVVIVTVHVAVTVIYTILSVAGMVFAIACLIFNLVFRNSKLIKLASSKLNYLTIGGGIILYLDALAYVLPSINPTVVNVYCHLTPALTALGFSFSYGTVVVKMARVYYIFHNPSSSKNV